MLKTRLTEAYGLDVPFISAGMAFIGMPALAAAVSNAGGMGTLGAALVPPTMRPARCKTASLPQHTASSPYQAWGAKASHATISRP